MYVRGNPRDYDRWEEEGNYDWSYEDVLPYFKKSEKNTDKDIIHHNPHYHGTKGYQLVGRFDYIDPNVRVLLDAWRELGNDNNNNTLICSLRLFHTSFN